jgi:hypothetical protein
MIFRIIRIHFNMLAHHYPTLDTKHRSSTRPHGTLTDIAITSFVLHDTVFNPCTKLQYPNSYNNCHSFVSLNYAAHAELPDEDGPCYEVDGEFNHDIVTYCPYPGPSMTPFRAPVIARCNQQFDIVKPPAVSHPNQKY